MKFSLGAFLCTFCWAVSLAVGRPIAITNFSFDDPDVADGSFSLGGPTLPGWTAGGIGEAPLIHDPLNGNFANATGNLSVLPGTADGFQALVITQTRSQLIDVSGLMHQETGEIITANTEYLLTVAVGNPLSGTPGNSRIRLTGNGFVLADSVASPPEGTFTDTTLLFRFLPGDPRIGQTLGIDLYMAAPQGTPPGIGFTAYFDNVRLTATAIPEPTILGAMMLSCGSMLTRRARQRRP
jgi:hypothetical protein